MSDMYFWIVPKENVGSNDRLPAIAGCILILIEEVMTKLWKWPAWRWCSSPSWDSCPLSVELWRSTSVQLIVDSTWDIDSSSEKDVDAKSEKIEIVSTKTNKNFII